MEEKFEYTITELWVDNDPLMKFIIKLDVIKNATIIEGHYKIKLDGSKNFRLFAKNEHVFFNVDGKSFDEMIRSLYFEIREKVELVEGVTNLFKDIDHVEIPNI